MSWAQAMDYSIKDTLKSPDSETPRASNNTWTYKKVIYFKDLQTGQLIGQFTSVVVWGYPGYNIVTAYPTKITMYGP